MLKYQIENLDGVEESLHSFYEQTEGGYRLKVDGVEDVSGLKSALEKERNGNKDAKTRLAELEKAREDAEKKALEEQGKYKELSAKEREEKLKYEQSLNDLLKEVATSKRDVMVRELASTLTSDAVEQEIISRFAQDYVQIEGKEVTFTKDVEDLKKDLAKFVRSKANDLNDRGNNGTGGGGNADKYKGMSSTELMKQGRNK